MASPSRFVIVTGTWEFDGLDTEQEWWKPEGEFVQFMNSRGFDYVQECGDGFVWTTALEGLDIFRYFGKKSKHAAWKAAAQNLKVYLKDIPVKDRNIIAHSHGGQVVAYACADGLEVNNVITVSTPIRKDMEGVYTTASAYMRQWTHVHSDKTDLIQILGTLFDGRFGVHRNCDQADFNITIKGVGHSKIVRDPLFFHIWDDYKLLDYLKDK